jgi:hypothetical protein
MLMFRHSSPPPFFQDILLITGSVLIFGSQITPLQVFGSLRRYPLKMLYLKGFFFPSMIQATQ